MELRTLKYFLAVAREENISRAAEVLHVTQPSLSRQMAQLEEELGATLFERGRHFQLTDAGMMLRARAQEIVELSDRIESDFEHQEEIGGMISIGCGGLMATRALEPVMASFRRLHPNVQYEIYANNADYVKERLDRGLLDFGVIMEPADTEKYEFIRLPEVERWGLLTRSDSPVGAKKSVTRADLKQLPLILPARNAMQKELASWFGRDLSRLDVFGTNNMLMPNTVDIVKNGDASCITVEGAAYLYTGTDLKFLPLSPALEMNSVLVWKKLHPSATAAGAFLEYYRAMRSAHDVQ
ncbi:MAG: LysR family transcriptional regulator [Solobacterium sp.]|nr:LysR family transcriptional regulator [Solobacterium sp.]MCH4222577.1 LysR family transcriptional regulator [Solobacterium sp.]MCH4265394.1 LysR family transcriptional regulator [Solobacterium sp.]